MANLNLNKAILAGRLTKDVELRKTPQGISVTSFTIAINREMQKDTTDFINCVAWRNTAEFITKYFRKGSSICVEGSIQVRNWEDNNGNKQYATEVLVDKALFVDSKNEVSGSAPVVEKPKPELYSNAPVSNFQEIQEDDDLPF